MAGKWYRFTGGFRWWKVWTGATILASISGLVLWNALVALKAPDPAAIDKITINRQILEWVTAHPFFSLGMGVLSGHWIWPIHRYMPIPSWKTWVLVSIGIVALALDIVGGLPTITPMVYVLGGVPLGHSLWPQRVRI